ncbi:MAG: hypothetical protein MUP55_01475 [Candidatus Aenigmarchaeota archaeon]|nr:hypothetical protein [Candidatus Aenigmarchaeota archaeon]
MKSKGNGEDRDQRKIQRVINILKKVEFTKDEGLCPHCGKFKVGNRQEEWFRRGHNRIRKYIKACLYTTEAPDAATLLAFGMVMEITDEYKMRKIDATNVMIILHYYISEYIVKGNQIARETDNGCSTSMYH